MRDQPVQLYPGQGAAVALVAGFTLGFYYFSARERRYAGRRDPAHGLL